MMTLSRSFLEDHIGGRNTSSMTDSMTIVDSIVITRTILLRYLGRGRRPPLARSSPRRPPRAWPRRAAQPRGPTRPHATPRQPSPTPRRHPTRHPRTHSHTQIRHMGAHPRRMKLCGTSEPTQYYIIVIGPLVTHTHHPQHDTQCHMRPLLWVITR